MLVNASMTALVRAIMEVPSQFDRKNCNILRDTPARRLSKLCGRGQRSPTQAVLFGVRPTPSGAVSANAFVKVFSLNLLHGQGGRAYPYAQVTQWLTEAGFASHTRHQLRASPNDQLIIAQ